MSVFMPIPTCFYYCTSIVDLEVGDGDASRSSLLYKIVLAILVFFLFAYDVEYCSFKVHEELYWDFDGYHTESVDYFGKIAIFTMLISSTQEHGRSFNFIIFSSISFFKDLKFLSYRLYTCLVKFVSRYFTLLVSIVNVDIFWFLS